MVKARKKCWAEANIDKMSGAMGTFPPIYFPSYSTRSIWKVIQKMMPWYSVPIPYGFPPCGIHNAINIINNFQGRNCCHIQPTTFGGPKKIIMAASASAFAALSAFSSSEPGLFCKSIPVPQKKLRETDFQTSQCTASCTEARETPPVPTPQIQDMHG